MLSLCQIESLREQISLLTKRFGAMESAGVIAGDILEESVSSADTAFVTSVDHIVSLIEGKDAGLKQKKNLVISIPVPTKDRIAVIFDSNWSAVTSGRHPRRWLVSRKSGSILLLNLHEYPVKAKLSFHLTTVIRKSSVRISQGQNCAIVNLRKKAAQITLNTILLPGENPIEIQFIGTADEAEEITNVAVSNLFVCGEENAMADDMKRLGTGYYAAVFPDSKVRNALHHEGYSEIESIRLFHDNSIQREKTTRFLQHDPNSSGDSFFTMKEGENQHSTAVSLRLYIAKKTGEIEWNPGTSNE